MCGCRSPVGQRHHPRLTGPSGDSQLLGGGKRGSGNPTPAGGRPSLPGTLIKKKQTGEGLACRLLALLRLTPGHLLVEKLGVHSALGDSRTRAVTPAVTWPNPFRDVLPKAEHAPCSRTPRAPGRRPPGAGPVGLRRPRMATPDLRDLYLRARTFGVAQTQVWTVPCARSQPRIQGRAATPPGLSVTSPWDWAGRGPG